MSGTLARFLHCRHRRSIAIWATAGLAATIAALTLVPLKVPVDVSGGDKLHHILAFAVLTLPCAALYPKGLLRVALTAVLFGALIEVVQPFVGREGEFADYFADAIGVVIGATLGLLLSFILRRRIEWRMI